MNVCVVVAVFIILSVSKAQDNNRGVTIRYPHDTIRIAILESRYDTYRDTW